MIELCISFLVLILFLFLLFYKSIREKQHRLQQILSFASYVTILEYHAQKAYEMIYKDRILIYSMEATKVTDSDFMEASVAFSKLVIKMIGPSLTTEFISLYGSEETFLFILTVYFNEKYEEDEIRKTSINDLQNKELGTED